MYGFVRMYDFRAFKNIHYFNNNLNDIININKVIKYQFKNNNWHSSALLNTSQVLVDWRYFYYITFSKI